MNDHVSTNNSDASTSQPTTIFLLAGGTIFIVAGGISLEIVRRHEISNIARATDALVQNNYDTMLRAAAAKHYCVEIPYQEFMDLQKDAVRLLSGEVADFSENSKSVFARTIHALEKTDEFIKSPQLTQEIRVGMEAICNNIPKNIAPTLMNEAGQYRIQTTTMEALRQAAYGEKYGAHAFRAQNAVDIRLTKAYDQALSNHVQKHATVNFYDAYGDRLARDNVYVSGEYISSNFRTYHVLDNTREYPVSRGYIQKLEKPAVDAFHNTPQYKIFAQEQKRVESFVFTVRKLYEDSMTAINQAATKMNQLNTLPKYVAFKTKMLTGGMWKSMGKIGWKKAAVCALPILNQAMNAELLYEIGSAVHEMTHCPVTPTPFYLVRPGQSLEHSRHIADVGHYVSWNTSLRGLGALYDMATSTEKAIYSHTPEGAWGDHETLAKHQVDQAYDIYHYQFNEFCKTLHIKPVVGQSYTVSYDGAAEISYTTLTVEQDHRGVMYFTSKQDTTVNPGFRMVDASELSSIYQDIAHLVQPAYQSFLQAKADYTQWLDQHYDNPEKKKMLINPDFVTGEVVVLRQAQAQKQTAVQQAEEDYHQALLDFETKFRINLAATSPFTLVKNEPSPNGMVSIARIKNHVDEYGLPIVEWRPELINPVSQDGLVHQPVQNIQVVDLTRPNLSVSLPQEKGIASHLGIAITSGGGGTSQQNILSGGKGGY